MKTWKPLALAALLAPLLLLAAAGLRDTRPPSDLKDAPNSGQAADQLSGLTAPAQAPAPAAKAVRAAPQAEAPRQADPRCAPPAAGEEVIYQSDFHWNYPMKEMMERFDEMYVSPKRLDKRAYWDKKANSLVLPSTREDEAPVKIGPALIDALRWQIERALQLGYADAVFFPDMGHSHLLIPDALWESKYATYPNDQTSRMYEEMLSDPAIQIFYHTAEQLKFLQDNQPIQEEALLFRRANRNIAGPIKPSGDLTVFQNPASAANTVGEVPGYRWWGAGFNFSAQKDGCFTYRHKGKTYRYDISLHDLPMKPGSGEDWQ
ncbi:MAG: hypothetical protein NDI60_11500 [Elusimicrobiales bacterium]|nr:hypothetical protein [Elusimicrobiales bacterium]